MTPRHVPVFLAVAVLALVAPLGVAGSSFADVPPAPVASQAFTVRCPFSHLGSVDPIVLLGKAGASHMHEFFGNESTNQDSTAGSLQANDTTCAKTSDFTDANDRSAYWVPVLYENGSPIQATAVYVRYGNPTGSKLTAFPVGFKSVTGRASQSVTYGCALLGQPTINSVDITSVPTCTADRHLVATITFPDCWDGVSLDAPDHSSNLVPATGTGKRSTCPADHPVRVPQVSLTLTYPAGKITSEGATLSSGGPSTMHADMFEAWINDGLNKRLNG